MGPQAKRRKVASAVEEISFDPTARHDFLTGFHKRKVQRIKLAQEHAEKKAREERIEDRKKIREQRAAELEQAINQSRQMLQEARGSDSSAESGSENEEEWDGFEEPAPVDYEEEYIDEDKYTTVTVEEMGLSRDELHGLEEKETSSPDDDNTDRKEKGNSKDEAAVKTGRKQSVQKKKKKKFRYESKEERKVTRKKQKLGRQKKATARRER